MSQQHILSLECCFDLFQGGRHWFATSKCLHILRGKEQHVDYKRHWLCTLALTFEKMSIVREIISVCAAIMNIKCKSSAYTFTIKNVSLLYWKWANDGWFLYFRKHAPVKEDTPLMMKSFSVCGDSFAFGASIKLPTPAYSINLKLDT